MVGGVLTYLALGVAAVTTDDTSLVRHGRGYAQIAASWCGQTADLRTVTWDEFRGRKTTEDFCETSWEHLLRNHCCSIEKARRLLGYAPRYQAEDASPLTAR